MWPERFERIEVHGFKSFDSANVELRPLNVIIGPNGAGKSNLLTLLRMLRAISVGELEYFVLKSGGANDILRRAEPRTLSLDIALHLITKSGKSKYTLNCERTDDDGLLVRSEKLERFELDGDSRGAEIQNRATRESVLLAQDRGGSEYSLLSRLRVFHFHDTSRHSPPRLPGDQDVEHLGEAGENIASVLLLLERRYPKVFRRIEATIRQVFPGFAGFAIGPWAAEPSRIRLRCRERGSPEAFESHLLSDGTLRLILLATVLSLPPELAPPVIAIDEPELGLHPAAISIVAGLLKSASQNCQVIVCTQSAAILDMIDADDVIVVDRIDEHREFKRLDSTALAEWLETYTLGQIWEKNVIGGSPFA